MSVTSCRNSPEYFASSPHHVDSKTVSLPWFYLGPLIYVKPCCAREFNFLWTAMLVKVRQERLDKLFAFPFPDTINLFGFVKVGAMWMSSHTMHEAMARKIIKILAFFSSSFDSYFTPKQ